MAQSLEVRTELAKRSVVHFAIQRDVVLDLRAAVYPMKDVRLQVLVYGFILFQSVQKYSMEGQQLNYFLQRKKKKYIHARNVYYSLSKLNSYYSNTFETPLRPSPSGQAHKMAVCAFRTSRSHL